MRVSPARTCQSLAILLVLPAMAAAQDEQLESPFRITVVISSSDEFVSDLEHIVVDLAGRNRDWEDHVLPNVDVSLFGVDRLKPIRVDLLFGANGSVRQVWTIPGED